MSSVRISAIVVNYESGSFALPCVRSIVRAAGERPLEIVVIDNASPSDQTVWLDACTLEGARTIEAGANLGYAGGIQRALAETSGGPEDLVLVMNPDVVLLPDTLERLAAVVETNPCCGAVAPRAFLDEELSFQLPLPPLPSAWNEALEALAPCSRRVARSISRSRTRSSLELWTSGEPVRVPMLPGACLLLRRAVIEELGLLLDPGYPLYYEDSDLCRRLTERGYELLVDPAARVVHHWSRSAGAGAAFEEGPRARWGASRDRYHRRWSGAPSRAALALAEVAARKLGTGSADRAEALGSHESPFQLELPGEDREALLVELSATPAFTLAASHVATSGTWRFPPTTWSWLFAGRYWLRAMDVLSGAPRGAWSFEKPTAAREHGLDLTDAPAPDDGSMLVGLAGVFAAAERAGRWGKAS